METDGTSRVINIISVLVALTVGTATAYTIYIRTIERAEGLDTITYTDLELGDDGQEAVENYLDDPEDEFDMDAPGFEMPADSHPK